MKINPPRRLEIADLTAVLNIEQQNDFPWTQGILHDCFTANDEIHGVEADGKIIAYAVMRCAFDEAEILNIVVDKNFRRKGYGKLLLQQLLNLAKQKNVQKVFLDVRVSNIAALKLYEQLGFEEIGWRENYYRAANGREDAIQLCINVT